MLSCEFCEISKNTFFTEHLWWLLLKESPQDDFISGVFFKIAFENALRDLHSELKNNPNIEHSYSKVSFLPTEMIYANDSDFPTQSQVKSNEIKTKTNSRHSLKVSDEKWSISLDQYSKVLYSLFLLYAKPRAIKIFETKLQTTCIYLVLSFFKKQKQVRNQYLCIIFYTIFEEKYFS